MEKLEKPTLIVICGWALTGKSAIAVGVTNSLGFHWIDIDNVRSLNLGRPNPNQKTPEEREIDKKEMLASYELLFQATSINLALGRSVIITATFSREVYWKMFNRLLLSSNTNLKIISCEPQNDSEEEIRNRLNGRVFGQNTWSAVNSIELYREVKARYKSPELPHLKLDTSQTIHECLEEALTYITS